MNIYLAASIPPFKRVYDLDKKERGEAMDIYLAGPEFLGGYLKRNKGGDNMDIYLAGTEARGKELHKFEESIFSNANILQSFYYCDEFSEKVVIPQAKRFLLDSGAFTFFSSDKSVDWNEYIKKYAAFINRNNIKHFFELDIDALVGYEKVLDFRNRLEDLTGKPTIPVWHFERGKDAWLEMCEQYDYVAIGGLVSGGGEYAKKHRRHFPWFIKTAHERGAKVHALGFTAVAALKEYHFDSVDSTAWISGNQYGGVYEFKGGTIIKHKKPDGMRMAQPGKLALHNFREWVKFSEYAEVKL